MEEKKSPTEAAKEKMALQKKEMWERFRGNDFSNASSIDFQNFPHDVSIDRKSPPQDTSIDNHHSRYLHNGSTLVIKEEDPLEVLARENNQANGMRREQKNEDGSMATTNELRGSMRSHTMKSMVKTSKVSSTMKSHYEEDDQQEPRQVAKSDTKRQK